MVNVGGRGTLSRFSTSFSLSGAFMCANSWHQLMFMVLHFLSAMPSFSSVVLRVIFTFKRHFYLDLGSSIACYCSTTYVVCVPTITEIEQS